MDKKYTLWDIACTLVVLAILVTMFVSIGILAVEGLPPVRGEERYEMHDRP